MRYSLICTAVLALAAAFPAWAESASPSPSLDEIRVQQTQLRDAARAGSGAFADLSGRERDALVQKQDVLLGLIEGTQSVEQLDEPVRMDVFNRLEEIRAIVDKAENNRVVCTYETKVGTHMKTRICKTVAERQRDREQAVDAMNSRAICGNCKGL